MSDKDELGKTLPRSSAGSPGAAHQAPREVLPVQHEGRYTLPEGVTDPELGRGGMGRVLTLVDTHLHREVAVKELLREHTAERSSTGPLLENLFVREARVLALLEHPGVVPVYELGRNPDGTPYYVMQRLRGRSLATALEHCVSLDERLSLLSHFIDVVQTVGYAHSKGVVHRDLKPENVMVSRFGETHVIDWGLAVVGREPIEGGAMAGTPAYMSPEQADGSGVDARSDVWALGVMLFELLTGRLPFEGAGPSQLLDAVRTAPIPSVTSLEPAAPPALVAVVEKALTRAPSLRFVDAGVMADALEAAQRARAPKARGPLIATAALALACAALLVVALHASGRADDATRDARIAVADAQRAAADVQAEAALTAWRERDATTAQRLAEKVKDVPLARGVLALVAERGVPTKRWSVTVPAGCSSLAVVGTTLACATLNGVSLIGADGALVGELSTGPVGWQHAVIVVDGAFVSGGDDRVLRYWDTQSKKEAKRVEGFTAGIRALAFDGADVFAGLADGAVLRVAVDGSLTEVTKHPRPVMWLAATPGQVSSVSESLLRVTGPMPMELDRQVGAVAALTAHDFALGVERSVVLVRNGDVKVVGSGHRDDVTALTSTDERLISGSADGTVRWWFADGSLEGVLDGFAPGVQALATSGDTLFVATTRRRLEAWSLPPRVKPPEVLGVPSSYAWWPNGGLVMGLRDGRLLRVDEATNELEARHFKPVRGIARVFGDETSGALRFISGGDDGRVLAQRWNGSVDVLDALDGARVLAVAASPKATHVAWAADDGARVLWSLEFDKEVARSKDTLVRVLAFSPDGRTLALGRDDKHLTLVEVATGKETKTLGPVDGAISALAWSPDGRVLISGSTDGHLTSWSMEDGRATRTWTQPGSRIGSVDVNATHLAAGSDDGSTWLYSWADGALVAQLPSDSGDVMLVAFTADALIVAGRDRVIHSFPLGDAW